MNSPRITGSTEVSMSIPTSLSYIQQTVQRRYLHTGAHTRVVGRGAPLQGPNVLDTLVTIHSTLHDREDIDQT